MRKLKYHALLEAALEIAESVVERVKHNPVLVGTAALWAFESLTTGDALTWQTAGTVAIGFVIRAHVVPAHEVIDVAEWVEKAAAAEK